MAGYMEWSGGTMTHADFTAAIGGSGRKWTAEVWRCGVSRMRACGITTENKARACAVRFIEQTKDQDRARWSAARMEREALRIEHARLEATR